MSTRASIRIHGGLRFPDRKCGLSKDWRLTHTCRNQAAIGMQKSTSAGGALVQNETAFEGLIDARVSEAMGPELGGSMDSLN